MSDDAPKTLKHAADRYGGVIVDPACLPDDIEMFADSLHASVVAWKEARRSRRVAPDPHNAGALGGRRGEAPSLSSTTPRRRT
jgi:hypothetical protein